MVFALCMSMQSQECVWVADTLRIHIYSKEIVEDIDAEYVGRGVAYNSCSDSIAVVIPSAGFVFKNKLMGEHYRENYMEVSKYPQMKFKGKVNLPVKIDMMETGKEYEGSVSGVFTIHGVSREETIRIHVLNNGDGTLAGTSVFYASPTDYGIKQPSLMGVKAGEKIQVSIFMKLKPYKSKK